MTGGGLVYGGGGGGGGGMGRSVSARAAWFAQMKPRS